ncbi:hypothetical protein P7C70_g167, partial [Phenoliferia sp. Uapishka_3]
MITPTPTRTFVAGDVEQLRFALSESALIQKPPTPGRLSPSGNGRFDLMLETLFRLFPILLMKETAMSALDNHPIIITAYALALSMCDPGSEPVSLEEGDRAMVKFIPGFVNRKMKHGTHVDIIGWGPVHANVYLIDPEFASNPWLLDIFSRLDCLTFGNIPLGAKRSESTMRMEPRPYKVCLTPLYDYFHEDFLLTRQALAASTDPCRRLIKAPVVAAAKTVQLPGGKESAPVPQDPRKASLPARDPVLGKSDPKATLLSAPTPEVEKKPAETTTLKRKASLPKSTTHGHAPTTKGLFGQCIKLRREEDWRSEATPESTTVGKYPRSRLPSRLPRRSLANTSEVEERLAAAKALESLPGQSTISENRLGNGLKRDGTPLKTLSSITVPHIPVAEPSPAPAIRAYQGMFTSKSSLTLPTLPFLSSHLSDQNSESSPDCIEALEGYATEGNALRLTIDPIDAVESPYVHPTRAPCNSPIDILHGSRDARLGRIGSGDFEQEEDQHEARERRRFNEFREAMDIDNFAKSIEVAKSTVKSGRKNLVSTLEEILSERNTYWARLQPTTDNPASLIQRPGTPFSRCVSPPPFSPYYQLGRMMHADIGVGVGVDPSLAGYRYETSSVARPVMYNELGSLPAGIYSMGAVELLTPVPEANASDEDEGSEDTIIGSPEDGLLAANPIVVGRENDISPTVGGKWHQVRAPVADDWQKVLTDADWCKVYGADGSWKWARVDGRELSFYLLKDDRHRGARKLHNVPRPRSPSPVLLSLTDIDNHHEADFDHCDSPMDTEDSGECDEYLDYEVRALTKLGRQSKRNISLAKNNWNRAIRAHVKLERILADCKQKNSREKGAKAGRRNRWEL